MHLLAGIRLNEAITLHNKFSFNFENTAGRLGDDGKSKDNGFD
jgi:hypothetical protein